MTRATKFSCAIVPSLSPGKSNSSSFMTNPSFLSCSQTCIERPFLRTTRSFITRWEGSWNTGEMRENDPRS